MKTINIKVILLIYLTQGLNDLIEFLNRIEYVPTDEFSSYIMRHRTNNELIYEYLKKTIPNEKS